MYSNGFSARLFYMKYSGEIFQTSNEFSRFSVIEITDDKYNYGKNNRTVYDAKYDQFS